MLLNYNNLHGNTAYLYLYINHTVFPDFTKRPLDGEERLLWVNGVNQAYPFLSCSLLPLCPLTWQCTCCCTTIPELLVLGYYHPRCHSEELVKDVREAHAWPGVPRTAFVLLHHFIVPQLFPYMPQGLSSSPFSWTSLKFSGIAPGFGNFWWQPPGQPFLTKHLWRLSTPPHSTKGSLESKEAHQIVVAETVGLLVSSIIRDLMVQSKFKPDPLLFLFHLQEEMAAFESPPKGKGQTIVEGSVRSQYSLGCSLASFKD